jgi:hypothetical protein
VKVIEHNTDTTVPVEREVTLMLSFNHPNVVRAFHFVTRVHTAEVRVRRQAGGSYGLGVLPLYAVCRTKGYLLGHSSSLVMWKPELKCV